MAGPKATDWYDAHAKEAADRYESLSFAELHGWLIYLLPKSTESLVLDIGAGSGRDAAWFAERGHEIIAVEPSPEMRREGERRHPHPKIRWVDDQLPELSKVSRLGTDFDIILLSAVWMHVVPGDRACAFRSLTSLLKPGGLLVISLRYGPADPERELHPVGGNEVESLAHEQGLRIVKSKNSLPDQAGRQAVHWTQMVLAKPLQDEEG